MHLDDSAMLSPSETCEQEYHQPPAEQSFIMSLKPLYRYYHPGAGHLYTSDWNELGNGRHGFQLERIECLVQDGPDTGAVPLFRFRQQFSSQEPSIYFYTTDWNEYEKTVKASMFTPFLQEGIAGYVYPVRFGNLIPLYRYYSTTHDGSKHYGDHFYTCFLELRNSHEWPQVVAGTFARRIPGYNFEGVAAWVVDPITHEVRSAPVTIPEVATLNTIPGLSVRQKLKEEEKSEA
jgi:hypothetical protein